MMGSVYLSTVASTLPHSLKLHHLQLVFKIGLVLFGEVTLGAPLKHFSDLVEMTVVVSKLWSIAQ